MMPTSNDWLYFDALHFVNNLFLSEKTDEALDIVLRRLFAATASKLILYTRCTHAIHLFSNCIYRSKENTTDLEFDYTYVQPADKDFLRRAVKERSFNATAASNDQGLPLLLSTRLVNHREVERINCTLKELLCDVSPWSWSPVIQERVMWESIFRALRENPEGEASVPEIECSSGNLLVIPFSQWKQNFPTGQLGTLILWNNDAGELNEVCMLGQETITLVVKLLSASIARMLKTYYNITEETYLPKYRHAGEKKVAIMFADIRDFTKTTEILRNFGLLDCLTIFMRKYSQEICNIIQKHRGRIQCFAGDGIMALFGEYMSTPMEAVKDALLAAQEMCGAFWGLREEFFNGQEMQAFFTEKYEPMELKLGIGINFGQVTFDYFGAVGSRVYSPLGDHVNFAQRLESEASRLERAPILISRPAWMALGQPENLRKDPLSIEVKGKPYHYQAFQCHPNTAI